MTARGRATTVPPLPADHDHLEMLYAIQTVLARSFDIEQACDALLPIVTRGLRIRTAVLLVTTEELHRSLQWGAAGIVPDELESAREHAERMLADLTRGEIGLMDVVSHSAPPPGGVAEQVISSRSSVTLPLSLDDGRVFGVFQLEAAIAFDGRDLLFIKAVANQLAVALDRHQVHLQLETSRSWVERAKRRLEDLQVISSAIEGATLDESLSAVLGVMRAMFATEVAAVLLASADGKTLECRASSGLDDAHDVISVGTGAVGAIAAAGTAMIFDDLDRIDGVSPALRSSAVRSMLGAPLRARKRLTGVVYVASRDRRRFTPDELQLLALVADRIGTVIENATLYERALAAIRRRDVVMSVVSHDLRNPLGAIQMCTDLLAIDDPQQARPVSIIKRSVDLMDRLIGDLQDVASIEAGHLSIHPRHHELRALVRDAIDGAQAAASRKSIRIDMRHTAEQLAVECDRQRIIQVLTNLLSNAVEFTPPHGSITVIVTRADADHSQISVADTGCGIREDDLPRVFDHYWEARDTAHLGIGLGAAIAKGIVETHGGAMSVESRVDHGTTFSFTLPLRRVRATSGTRRDRVADPG
jgi:signal transduction histidine kinase